MASCAFSALCMYLKFGHHPCPLGYVCAKCHFFRSLNSWEKWRKIVYLVTQSLTHPAYLMPQELKHLRFGTEALALRKRTSSLNRSDMARVNWGITQFYLPPTHTTHTCLYLILLAAKHHCPLGGTHCAYPQRDGQNELTWLAGYSILICFWHWEMNPRLITHPSTYQAQYRVTLLIETNAVPVSQTAMQTEVPVRTYPSQTQVEINVLYVIFLPSLHYKD